MGQPSGIGNERFDPKGSGPKVSPNIFTGPGGDDRSPGLFPSPSHCNCVGRTLFRFGLRN
jgi:hypothetical protein